MENKFEKEIEILAKVKISKWEYCNRQKDENNKDSTIACHFVSGKVSSDERTCKLFDSVLFSSFGWIKKCDKCLEHSKELNINGEKSKENL